MTFDEINTIVSRATAYDIPKGLSYPDEVLFMYLWVIYYWYKLKFISKEDGTRLKEGLRPWHAQMKRKEEEYTVASAFMKIIREIKDPIGKGVRDELMQLGLEDLNHQWEA